MTRSKRSRYTLTNNFAAVSSLSEFDLSQNKSLQTLETMMGFVDRALKNGSLGSASVVLKYALSTIRSLEFSRVTFIYLEHYFPGVDFGRHSEWPHLYAKSQAGRAEEASWCHKHFELLHEIHQVRDFCPVLCANVWDPVGEYAVQVLKEAVAVGRANGWLDGSFPEPLVTYNPHWDLRCGALL